MHLYGHLFNITSFIDAEIIIIIIELLNKSIMQYHNQGGNLTKALDLSLKKFHKSSQENVTITGKLTRINHDNFTISSTKCLRH